MDYILGQQMTFEMNCEMIFYCYDYLLLKRLKTVIFKIGNRYFDIGHFPFPLTVTDTPGVNDPLLIREEISRQYLKESDFFVVVLSAHQALSRADLKLFRLMQALELGASDIHVEPQQGGLQLRFRQDGVLQSQIKPLPS